MWRHVRPRSVIPAGLSSSAAARQFAAADTAGVDVKRSSGSPQVCGSLSFLWQACLPQLVEGELQHRLVFQEPRDGEIGIETSRFDDGGFRFVHFALERGGGGQIEIGVEDVIAAVDRVLGVLESFVEAAEAEFSVGPQ